MALATRNQIVRGRPGTPCSIGAIYQQVQNDPTELAELNTILYEEGNTQAQVFAYLTDDGGFSPAFQSINKHRGRHCRCFHNKPLQFCYECRRDNASCICDAS